MIGEHDFWKEHRAPVESGEEANSTVPIMRGTGEPDMFDQLRKLDAEKVRVEGRPVRPAGKPLSDRQLYKGMLKSFPKRGLD